MQSFSAARSGHPLFQQIHPALTSFADEVCGTLARLFAYVGVLALFGILGLHALGTIAGRSRRGAGACGRLERRRTVLSRICAQSAKCFG